MSQQTTDKQAPSNLQSHPTRGNLAEIYALLKLIPPRYWHRLVAFAGARILNKMHLPVTRPIVLPLRVVDAWATPSGPCGLGFLVENAGGQIYSSFTTNSETGLLFDVGANAGFVSLMRCRANPSLRAVCFEPHAGTFHVLRQNIALNRLENRVQAMNVAVGAESGTLKVFQAEGDSMAAVSAAYLPKGAPVKQVSVPVISLDDYCAQYGVWPDAVKIDVEGHEEQVLLGACKAVARADRLVIECHSEALRQSCAAILESHGFELEAQGGLLFATRPSVR